MVHVAVIGAYGSAGAAVAQQLAEDPEVELTLIDDGDPGGGLCILRGCMPSKEVLSAGAHKYQARSDHRIGDAPEPRLEAIYETKQKHITEFAAHRRDAIDSLASDSSVEFLRETAVFLDANRLQVGDRVLEPDYIVVATGSNSLVPGLPGIDEVPVRTSADLLDATSFADSGLVMGFGYIGIELVPYLREIGEMDLTVIERSAHPLSMADPIFEDRLLTLYEEEFDITVHLETEASRLEATDDGGVRAIPDSAEHIDELHGEQLYAFTGRVPAIGQLALDTANIDPSGEWVTDTMQARDAEHVFVVGDANGKHLALHNAKEEGLLAARNIKAHAAGKELEEYDPLFHRVVFSGLGVYPYARLGHSAQTAEAAEGDYIVVTRDAADDGVFRTKDVPHGLAQLVVDATDGSVVGYQGLHYHADVMAKTMQIVIETGLDVRDIPDRAYHPTTPEILDGLIQDAADRLSS